MELLSSTEWTESNIERVWETAFRRRKEVSAEQVALRVAHSLGLASVEEGELQVALSRFASASVLAVRKLLKLSHTDNITEETSLGILQGSFETPTPMNETMERNLKHFAQYLAKRVGVWRKAVVSQRIGHGGEMHVSWEIQNTFASDILQSFSVPTLTLCIQQQRENEPCLIQVGKAGLDKLLLDFECIKAKIEKSTRVHV